MTYLLLYCQYNPVWVLASSMVSKKEMFPELSVKLHTQTPTWRTWDYSSPAPYPSTFLAWMTLSGAYAPICIALRVTEARKPPLHDKGVNFEEG